MIKISVKRRDGERNPSKPSPLYCVFSIKREKIRIPVKMSVTLDEWDSSLERVKGRGGKVRDRNLIIDNIRGKITDVLVKIRLSDKPVSRELFLTLYNSSKNSCLFVEFSRARLNYLGHALQPQTIRHHKAVIDKVATLYPDLQIEDITTEWLRVYAAKLRDIYNNAPGTVAKNMSIIRSYYMAAVRSGKASGNPFETFRLSHFEPVVTYLSEPELQALIKLFKSGTLTVMEEQVTRFFLFMSFTAMHISDARQLMIEQIFAGEIHYKRIKTGVSVSIPISEPAGKLIEYYKKGRRRGMLFTELPSDQVVNRVLKTVAEKAGIKKSISAKTGRHTFATLYYKKNRGDIGTLSKLLGHTSVKHTMIYAHIMKETRVSGVRAFDGLF